MNKENPDSKRITRKPSQPEINEKRYPVIPKRLAEAGSSITLPDATPQELKYLDRMLRWREESQKSNCVIGRKGKNK